MFFMTTTSQFSHIRLISCWCRWVAVWVFSIYCLCVSFPVWFSRCKRRKNYEADASNRAELMHDTDAQNFQEIENLNNSDVMRWFTETLNTYSISKAILLYADSRRWLAGTKSSLNFVCEDGLEIRVENETVVESERKMLKRAPM